MWFQEKPEAPASGSSTASGGWGLRRLVAFAGVPAVVLALTAFGAPQALASTSSVPAWCGFNKTFFNDVSGSKGDVYIIPNNGKHYRAGDINDGQLDATVGQHVVSPAGSFVRIAEVTSSGGGTANVWVHTFSTAEGDCSPTPPPPPTSKTFPVAWTLAPGVNDGNLGTFGKAKVQNYYGQHAPKCTITGGQSYQIERYVDNAESRRLVAGGILYLSPKTPNDRNVLVNGTAQVITPPKCTPSSVKVAPVTFNEGTTECKAYGQVFGLPTYTIPTSKVADYYAAGGKKVNAGTYDAKFGATLNVTAKASTEHPLKGRVTWTHKFGPKPSGQDCRKVVTPTTPTISQGTGSCKLNAPVFDQPYVSVPLATADYTFTLNGKAVVAGTILVDFGSTNQVEAVPTNKLVNLTVSSWTLKAGAKPNEDCAKPPVDVCKNIKGVQTHVPAGYDQKGVNCVIHPKPPVDVCKNIEGLQSVIPAGMLRNTAGHCYTPAPVKVTRPVPSTFGTGATAPSGDSSTGSGVALTGTIAMLGLAGLGLARRRRQREFIGR